MTLKSKRFHVYCSDFEFEQLNKKAETHNLSISRYLVQCGLSDNVSLSPHILKNIEQIRRETTLLQHHIDELLNKKSYLEQLLVSGELYNFIFFLTASAKYLHHIFLSNEKSNQSNQNNQNDKLQTNNSGHNPSDERKDNQINNPSNGNGDNSKPSNSAATSLPPSQPLDFSQNTNILLQFPTAANLFSFSHSESHKENLIPDDQQNYVCSHKSLSDSNPHSPNLDLADLVSTNLTPTDSTPTNGSNSNRVDKISEQIINKNLKSEDKKTYIGKIQQTSFIENQGNEIKDDEIKTFVLDINNSANSLLLEQHLGDEHNANLDDKNLMSGLSNKLTHSLLLISLMTA